MTHGANTQTRHTSPPASTGHQDDSSLHGSAPEVRPSIAIAVSLALLGLWLGVTVFASPLAELLAEALTRIELRWLAGELPWTP